MAVAAWLALSGASAAIAQPAQVPSEPSTAATAASAPSAPASGAALRSDDAPVAPAPGGSGLTVRTDRGVRFGPTVRREDSSQPVVIEADKLSGRPDLETIAEGAVDFRRGATHIKAERIEYRQSSDMARATGDVEIQRNGNTYTGPEVGLKVQRFEGYFVSPTYHFGRTNAGGVAQRFDFIDETRGIATGATYTSCPAPDPAWVLTTDRVVLDTAADEGIAEGAVLRFYGVPILAAPSLSFPLSDARVSGWLPPSLSLDNKSGLDVSAPYYWSIAPNRDATVTPGVMTRRGASLGAEYRYLEPTYQGSLQTFVLPNDQVAGRSRWSFNLGHEARWEGGVVGAVDYGVAWQRASDDNYWKDFPRGLNSLTPRLLSGNAQATRRFDSDWGETVTYARVQQWQVLQDPDPASAIITPYQRAPQIGVRQNGNGSGFEWTWETEANRFTNEDTTQLQGNRLHALGSLSYPWQPLGARGWTITPRVSMNAASYDLDRPMSDGRRTASRLIPTAAIDSAWVFERDVEAFGRSMTQTLEPRVLYVDTPFRDQSRLPNFDSAPNDFNFTSIYQDNTFSGVDRVSDANRITAGVTTRFIDRNTGVEALRLGLAQGIQLRDQRITADGEPSTERLSDLLLLAATSLVPNWWLDGTVDYNGETRRTQRSVLGARYSPGPLRTVNLVYRFTRDASEQFELGWQWPINGAARDNAAAVQAREALERDNLDLTTRGRPSAGCAGGWYSVGRVNYSRRDARITDSIVGFEYDSGCWIGRIVAERLSTGRTEATTRLLFQLELIGLSRLGSNPLKVLRDNIPGYRLLRDDSPVVAPALTIP